MTTVAPRAGNLSLYTSFKGIMKAVAPNDTRPRGHANTEGHGMRMSGAAACLLTVLLTAGCSDSTEPKTEPKPPFSAVEEPPTPHVWLHYDYLVYPDGHNDAPDPAAMQLVVDVYAAHGIVLEIDNHHTPVPSSYTYLSVFPGVACALYVGDVKSQYFHPTSNHEWHYALFGDAIIPQITSGCTGAIPGEAEINGDNLVIGMKLADRFGLQGVAASFMHELGHNLGLHHGGFEDLNNKPNYLSVMNYSFPIGIPHADILGSIIFAGYRLDYSEAVLPQLDASHLNETVGIQAGTTDITVFRVDCSDLWEGCVGFGEGPATGPIDWNLDGSATETDVAVRFLPFCAGGICAEELLIGFDDWAEVRGYILGTIVHGPKTIAHEDAAEQPTVSSIAPTSGPATGGTAVTITGDHFGKATQVLFGSAGPAVHFEIVNVKTIVAISPATPNPLGGPVDVTVVSGIDPSPSVTADVFTYPAWQAPVVRNISPQVGPVSGGTVVTLHGDHLAGVSAVTFDATPAPTFQILNDTTILVTTPPGPTGLVRVRVTSVGGSSDGSFAYLPPPTVVSISPATGSDAGGTAVTITILTPCPPGGIDGVFFGSTPAATFTEPVLNCFGFSSEYVIFNASAPPGAGSVDITVSDAGGVSAPAAVDVFTFLPLPVITMITPTSGSAGTAITIAGRHLGTATAVYFYDNVAGAAATFTVVDDATIQAIVPPLSPTPTGTVPIVVVTPLGPSNGALFTPSP
jgi:IPT/TIG domain-containing protein